MALLRAYVDRRDEHAFDVLVSRHVNKVYSVALRQTGNPHSAQDITQTVFFILAKKAPRMGRRVILSGWLYQTARWTSLTWMRAAIRRHQHEEKAAMQSEVDPKEPETLPEIAPLLDSAIGSLSELDRQAVVLRYFDGKSLRQVADALGANEEAAKKRVARALEKLRAYFARRGVNSTTAIVADAISAQSVQAAPAAFAKSVTSVALAKGMAANPYTSTLVRGALRLMIWNKVKFVVLAGAGLLLASGIAVVAIDTARAAAERSEANALIDESKKVFDRGLRGVDLADAMTKVMKSHQNVALIRPSQFRPGELIGKTSGFTIEQGHVQIAAYLPEVLRYAYNLDPRFPQNRIIIPTDLVYARYDLVNTTGPGEREALQRQLKEQFGIAAEHQKRKNLLLIAHDPAAPKLHPHNDAETNAEYKVKNVTMPALADYLTKALGVKVTDQTGLRGGFDYSLDAQIPPTPEELKTLLSAQLGLDLVPASDNEETDFLVAQEISPPKRP